MAALKTHLSALAEHARAHPTLPILKLPVYDSRDELRAWRPVSYSEFQSDVEHFATHLAHKLQAGGILPRSVVGLWSNGMSYVDVLYIYAIARAGYIPQLFSLRLPNPDVIYELLERANAKAIIYEPSLADVLSNCPYPAYSAEDLRDVAVGDAVLPPLFTPSPEDVAMIFHTSGSTSGRPKLLPCNYKWLDNMISKSATVSRPLRKTGQDVTVAMGSMCHIGQTFMFLASFQNGACTIQPRAVTFSTDELVHMITQGGLNRLNQFPAFFAVHARAARQNPKLLALLRGLDEILYSGQQMPREDEEWAYANDLQIRNLFGSTECGAMLLSIRGGGKPAPSLRPIEGTSYAFIPIEDGTENEGGETQYTNANARLLELVILADSGDCPHVSMRGPDGHYHTGDLFVEVAPGEYVNRGRGDDWIKSENCLRCDTRAIEDNARQSCADLIAECIVVGNGRPSPAIFVEPAQGLQMDDARLRREIIRRTRAFHARRYLHERITSAKMVVVVPRGTLPRTATKGNVRRRAVEDMFKAELDAMFASA
ncbi:acetyl-CoA synthetase-like protein [Trametes polyzona]|nr:acetyl-CoA synthetase-like protein [Trametes polyzona]